MAPSTSSSHRRQTRSMTKTVPPSEKQPTPPQSPARPVNTSRRSSRSRVKKARSTKASQKKAKGILKSKTRRTPATRRRVGTSLNLIMDISLGANSVSNSEHSQPSDTDTDGHEYISTDNLFRPFTQLYSSIPDSSKFMLSKGEFLEDRMYKILLEAQNPTSEVMDLLTIGFVDINRFKGQIFSRADIAALKSLVGPLPPTHQVQQCVKNNFAACKSWEDYVHACDQWKYCADCRQELKELEYYRLSMKILARFCTLQYAEKRTLEGNFDINLWAQLLDWPLFSEIGTYFRKEKGARYSNVKFDGIFIGGAVNPQEWLVSETACTQADNVGAKQSVDRQKVLDYCKVMSRCMRNYVRRNLGLRRERCAEALRRLPVWGVVCAGLKVEILKFVWVTPYVVGIYAFSQEVPSHVGHLENTYPVLRAVMSMTNQLRESVLFWNRLHGKQETDI